MLSQSSATDHKRNQNREIYYSQVPEKTPWGAAGWGQSMVQRERENIGHMFLSGSVGKVLWGPKKKMEFVHSNHIAGF